MSAKQKSIAKILGGLLALFGSAFGANEAGVMPDLAELERLGVLGSLLLVVYVEVRFMKWAAPIRQYAVSKVGEPAAEPEEAEDDATPHPVKIARTGPTHVIKGEPT
jgi:hypothetical protein